MYRLEAFSADDGWAIVKGGSEYFLLRPPYLLRDRVVLSEDEVIRVLSEQRLEARTEAFESLGALVRLLVSERAALPALDGDLTPEEAASEVLLAADADDLDILLDMVEQDWLSQREWRSAERALIALLTLPALSERPELMPRVQALLQQCQRLRDRPPVAPGRRQHWYAGTDTPDRRAVAEEIARSRAVLPMAKAA